MIKQRTILSQATFVSRRIAFINLPNLSLVAALVFLMVLVSLFIGISLPLSLLTGFGALGVYKLFVYHEQNRSEEDAMSMALKASFETSIIRYDLAMKERKFYKACESLSCDEMAHQIKTDAFEPHGLYQQESSIKTEGERSRFEFILKRFDEYELVLERTRHQFKKVNNPAAGDLNVVENHVEPRKPPTTTNLSRLFSKRIPVAMGREQVDVDFISKKTKS